MANVSLNTNTVNQLKELATMAYGHGSTSAGAGRIGMIGNKVVKFNTHIGERLSSSSGSKADMIRSCDALRVQLGRMATEIYGKTGVSAGMQKVLQQLGLDENGSMTQGGKTLLDRKLVAKFIEQVKADSSTKELDGVKGGATIKSSAFSAVQKSTHDEQVSEGVLSGKQLLAEFAQQKGLAGLPQSTFGGDLEEKLFGGLANLSGKVLKGEITLGNAKSALKSFKFGVHHMLSKSQTAIFGEAKEFLQKKLDAWAKGHAESVKQGYVKSFGCTTDRGPVVANLKSVLLYAKEANGDVGKSVTTPSLEKYFKLQGATLRASDRLARAVLDGRMKASEALEKFKTDCESSFEGKARDLLEKADDEANLSSTDGEYQTTINVFYEEIGARLQKCEDMAKVLNAESLRTAPPKKEANVIKPKSPEDVTSRKAETTKKSCLIADKPHTLTLLNNAGAGDCFFYAALGNKDESLVYNKTEVEQYRKDVSATAKQLLEQAKDNKTTAIKFENGIYSVKYSDDSGKECWMSLSNAVFVSNPKGASSPRTEMDQLDAAFLAHHEKRPVVVYSNLGFEGPTELLVQKFDFDLETGDRFPEDREPIRIYYSPGHFQTITNVE